MRQFLKKHNVLTRILSLMLAICLWFIVMKEQNPPRTKIITDVPIRFVGADTLLEEQGLAVIEGQEQRVSLQILGATWDIGGLEKTNIAVEVDLSDVKEAGMHTFEYTVALPKNLTSLRLREGTPATVDLTLDKITEKTVPVRVELSAEPLAQYLYETPDPMQKEITLRGPETILSTIVGAHVVLPSAGLTENTALACEYKLLDAEGGEVTSPLITRLTEKVTVSLGVNKIATVPLEVRLIPSADVTEDMAKVTISPATVQVYGSPSAVEKLKSIVIDTVDLATEQTGAEREVTIPLPLGIKLVSGQASTAALSLQIDGMGSRAITIGEIRLVDTNIATVKPQVDAGEQVVQVTLRGKNSALTALNAADVKVSAAFDSALLKEGSNEVPITVTLPENSQDVSVLSFTETITVNVTGANVIPVEIPPDITGQEDAA